MASPLPNIAANLSRTLFQGNGHDIVATPDVYGVTSSAVINSSVGKYNGFNVGLLGNLQSGSNGLLGSMTNLSAHAMGLSSSSSGALVTLTSRLNSMMGQPLDSLTGPLQRGMSKGVGSISSLLSGGTSALSGGISAIGHSTGLSSLFHTVSTTIGGITQNIEVDDVTSALGAFNLVNQITGNRNTIGFLDVGPSSLALTSLTGTLIGMGLGIAVNELMNSSKSDTVTKTALAANLGAAIQASDLDTVQLCISKLGVGGVLTQIPNAALLLMTQYRLPAKATVAGYPALWTKLKGILVQLDPNWATGTRGGATLGSLAYFAAASADALTLARTEATYLTASLIGKGFPSTDLLTALRSQYPDMAKL